MELASDGVVGQLDFKSNREHHWRTILPSTFCWPDGLAMHKSTLVVGDSGNNRVTIWNLDAAGNDFKAAEMAQFVR